MTERSHPTNTLSLAQLLDTLGHTTFTALCYKPATSQFSTLVNTPHIVAATAAGIADADVWFSVNPVAGPARTGPRGNSDHVTVLACLWADLDIKPGACPDLDTAHQLINDLSIAIGTDPIAVIHSGHGLQPLWLIDDDLARDLDPDRRLVCTVLLKRWGRLVQTVAQRRGIAVDSVFDLPRILRAPGTINHKAEPVPAWCEAGTGAPLTLDEISERLDERDIPALDCDQLLDEPVDTSRWSWKADGTCTYAKKMIHGWASDQPTARHPWLLSQATRLAAAHRAGCLTHHDHQAAINALITRMQDLCATGSNARAVAPSEVADALRWGESQAARLTDTALTRELGGHDHTPQLTVIDGDNIAALSRSRTSAASSSGTAALAPAGTTPSTTATDLGNAQLLVHRHGGQLRYCPDNSRWYGWDGTRWTPGPDNGAAMLAAIEVAEALPADTKPEVAHKARSQSKSGLDNMVSLARFDPRIRLSIDQLDAHPHLLNTPTGTIDLRSGDQYPHRHTEHHAKITDVGVDTNLDTPLWDRYLADTFGSDTPLIGYMQRLLGYSITGQVTHHLLPFLYGQGQNGKSVLTDVLAKLLGSEYANTLPTKVLVGGHQHDTDLAPLAGARIAIASEVKSEGSWDEERVKALTGGDRLTARWLYANPFTFTPSHTLIMHGNHKPAVESGGKSFWRRLRLIPFDNTVPEERKIEGLADRLVTEEGPGVLAWLITGAAAQYADGLQEPEQVLAATREYAEEEDHFGQFIDECLHLAPNSPQIKAATDRVRSEYSAWCRTNGVHEMSAQAFGRELRRRTRTTITKSNGRKFYTGIGLIDRQQQEE